MMKNRVLQFLMLLFLSQTYVVFAAPVRVEHVEAELVSEVKSVKPGASFWVALRVRMDDGWHTYWRNPGDSGLETQVTWNLPKGFQASELEWPYPERLDVASLVTFGYQGEVFLLSKIEPPKTINENSDVTLSANTIWLSCSDICVPGQAQLDLKLPVSDDLPKLDERWAVDFAKARERLPKLETGWKMNAVKKGKKIVVTVTAEKPPIIAGKINFFPYTQGMFDLSAAQKISKNKKGFQLELPILKSYSKPISEVSGILVADQNWEGLEGKSVLIESKVGK